MEAVNGRKCNTPGCDRPHRAKGLCGRCYNKQLRTQEMRKAEYKWTDARRNSYHERRARKKNPDGTIERIDIAKIAERDKFICGICSEPVDMALVYPAAKSRSLDHVVPLSKGGAHTEGNVQLAHLDCNLDKSDTYEDLNGIVV